MRQEALRGKCSSRSPCHYCFQGLGGQTAFVAMMMISYSANAAYIFSYSVFASSAIIRRRNLGQGRLFKKYLYVMHLYSGQAQAADGALSGAVRRTYPHRARTFFFSLCHSNRMRIFGVRNMDGFLGPDGMTNVPASRDVGIEPGEVTKG